MKRYIALCVVSLCLVSTPALASSFDSNLKYGSQGSQVSELQEFLASQGFSVPITGNFYSLTFQAVKAFQKANGILPVSGYWGSLSRAKATSMLNLSISDNQDAIENNTATATPTIIADSTANVVSPSTFSTTTDTTPVVNVDSPTFSIDTVSVNNPDFIGLKYNAHNADIQLQEITLGLDTSVYGITTTSDGANYGAGDGLQWKRCSDVAVNYLCPTGTDKLYVTKNSSMGNIDLSPKALSDKAEVFTKGTTIVHYRAIDTNTGTVFQYPQ